MPKSSSMPNCNQLACKCSQKKEHRGRFFFTIIKTCVVFPTYIFFSYQHNATLVTFCAKGIFFLFSLKRKSLWSKGGKLGIYDITWPSRVLSASSHFQPHHPLLLILLPLFSFLSKIEPNLNHTRISKPWIYLFSFLLILPGNDSNLGQSWLID